MSDIGLIPIRCDENICGRPNHNDELFPWTALESPLSPRSHRTKFAGSTSNSNYLRQADDNPAEPAEHLLMFQVLDFEQGLRLLRTTIEGLGPPPELRFHNLDPSRPMY